MRENGIRLGVVVCVVFLASLGTSAGATLYVDAGGGAAYMSIQDAIDAAISGDQIEVAPGTYLEAINFNGKAIRLYSSGGAGVTTIDGTAHYHVVQCVSGEGPDTILDGFTITGGNAAEASPLDDGFGGGMFNKNSSPTVIRCTFKDNTARIGGGGMANESSSARVVNCTFLNNSSWSGGGMCNRFSTPTVINSTFTQNTGWEGGGMINDECGVIEITGCALVDNTATGGGGGGIINWGGATGTVANCIFRGNSAPGSLGWGGGLFNWQGSRFCTLQDPCPQVTNCTFAGNSAHRGGGGLAGAVWMANCVLWSNAGGQILGDPSVSHCDVQGSWPGEGNIDADPLFVNAAGPDYDYHLSLGSPCIDTGTNTPPGGIPPRDIDGNPRPVDGNGDGVAVADMGAYEAQPHPAGLFYLKDNLGRPLGGESIKVQPAYGGSWGPVFTGVTETDGSFWCDLDPTYTKVRMTLNQGSVEQTVSQLHASNYTWTAIPATVLVTDHLGQGIAGVTVSQGGSMWVDHGCTDSDGEVTIHVFADKNYKFRVNGSPVSNSSQTKTVLVSGGSGPIGFQTGYVVSDGQAVRASIGGAWVPYTSPGMRILPGTYSFVFLSPPSPMSITVSAGSETHIR